METGRRMASFRGISHCYQRPTYEDWPYSVFTMAHGRSKEECDAILDSIAGECGMGPDDRATLYSSTEYKKIRLHYFTDEYRAGKRSTRRGRSRRGFRLTFREVAALRPRPDNAKKYKTLHPTGTGALGPMRSSELYGRAVKVMPGGVNSPVRAMRQIGREPIFVDRGEGCELVDVDGNRYVDWVCSWGPLILGHADPRGRRGGRGGRATRHQLRRRDRGRGRAGRGGRRPRALGRDGADDQLRDRGGDERDPARPRGDRARGRGQVRRRLPRPLRRAARRGRLGPGDAGDPGQPGRARRPDRRHRGRPLERPRRGRASARRPSGRRRSIAEPIAGQHGRRPAAPRASSSSSAQTTPTPAPCWSSTR